MERLSEEELAALNDVNIIDYARASGIDLKQDSATTFRGVDHDSLVITPSKNAWFWNSRDTGGKGCLSFVTKYQLDSENISDKVKFGKAIELISKTKLLPKEYRAPEKKPFEFDKKQVSPNFSKALNYLTKTRGLNPNIMQELHRQGLICENRFGDALFLWKNPENRRQIEGLTKQGTTINHAKFGKRGTLKLIEKNSTPQRGFNFDVDSQGRINSGEIPENIVFFESTIDALSFYNTHLNGAKSVRLVSLEGLKEKTFEHYVIQLSNQLSKQGKKLNSVSLGVDNDEAGQKFVKDITKRFLKVHYLKPTFGKDWNDTLKHQRLVAKKKMLARQQSLSR